MKKQLFTRFSLPSLYHFKAYARMRYGNRGLRPKVASIAAFEVFSLSAPATKSHYTETNSRCNKIKQ